MTLTDAFAEYPWTCWSILAERYATRLAALQRLYLIHALAHGMVFVDKRVEAVAAFLPPNDPSLAADVQERVGAPHGDRLTALMNLSLPAAPDGAWTLATVGVAPSVQVSGRRS